MGILEIPNELLLWIGENLSIKDLSHFLSTCRQLSSLLTPRLHNLGVQDVGGLTALQWAANRGHASLAELAISRGAEIDKPNQGHFCRTPLHSAAEYNLPTVVRVLVEHGASIDGKDSHGMTPLRLATWNGASKATRVLLELGADMMCIDTWGETVAHLAARKGYIGCMEAFIDAGFDLNTRGPCGKTVLHIAAFDSNEMLEYLLRYEEVKTAINEPDSWGLTPLHLASWSSETIRELLHHGADMKLKDNRGDTPAHCASFQGTTGIEPLAAFIDAGFDLNTRGNHGRTVLHYAALYAGFDEEMVEYLLKQPGTRDIINAQDYDGLTPLALTATRSSGSGRERTMSLLVRYGAALGAREEYTG